MKRLIHWRNGLTLRQRMHGANACAIVGVGGIVCAVLLLQNVGIMFVVMAVMIPLTIGGAVFFYRCPHCDTYLGRLGTDVTYCPYCGKAFDHEK